MRESVVIISVQSIDLIPRGERTRVATTADLLIRILPLQ